MAQYGIGFPYKPSIVGGDNVNILILDGVAVLLFLLIIAYLGGQVVAPYIRYRNFRKKYVIEYSKNLVGPQGTVVGDECYLCKAPFQEGDLIVAKCQHTKHEECWEENEQHCPEHGRKCPDGSHYYNKEEIFTDLGNASYYLWWILVALAAGFIGWALFLSPGYLGIGRLTDALVDKIISGTGAVRDSSFQSLVERIKFVPVRAMELAFVFTAFFTMMTLHNQLWYVKFFRMLVRSTVAAVVSGLAFFVENFLIAVFNIHITVYLLDVIPWIISVFAIAQTAALHTGVKLQYKWFVVTGVVCWGTVALWMGVFGAFGFDYRVYLLFSFQLLAIGIGMCLAKTAPRSESYFLEVSGATKEMDIALYKWFKASPDRVVRLGKSVDCELNLSWDIQSMVPPMAAEIFRQGSTVYLKPLEDCVFMGQKMLKIGRNYRLYHGRRFSIGKTVFMYVEKDY